MTGVVHLIAYASQPDIQFRCDGSWSTPRWGDASTETEGVYLDDDGRLYTFDEALVTCPQCPPRAPTEEK